MSDAIRAKIDGLDVLALVPSLSEDLPPAIREGIARRRLMATGAPCPCGAQPPRLNRALRRAAEARRRRGQPGEVIRIAIEHENGCPATDEALAGLAAEYGLTVRRWLS